MKLSCAEVLEQIDALAAEDLGARDDAACRAHLADCHTCRQAFGVSLRAHRSLAALADPSCMTQAPGFFARLREDTLAAVAAERPVEAAGERRMPRINLAGVMTAAALFLIGVYLLPMAEPAADDGDLRNLPPIKADQPRIVARDARFRDVSYQGLLVRFRLDEDLKAAWRDVLSQGLDPEADTGSRPAMDASETGSRPR